ncbi:MAG: SDR family oxidoreductase [Myxococcota bacterium]
MQLAVTGANGAIGRIVLRAALAHPEQPQLLAIVRSERAERELPPIPKDRGEVRRADYHDLDSLRSALLGAESLVHLPGILVEGPGVSFMSAHVDVTRNVVAAAREVGVRKLVVVSTCGADPRASNAFLQSKGQADALACEASIPYTVLRAPLVLGAATAGGKALRGAASRALCWLIGGGNTLHRPLDVWDLAEACLCAACHVERARNCILDLVGPEAVRYRDLVERAARCAGRAVRIAPLPLLPLRLGLGLIYRLRGMGFSPDALEVLLTDTSADPTPACRELGIELTPLDSTIERSLRDEEDA